MPQKNAKHKEAESKRVLLAIHTKVPCHPVTHARCHCVRLAPSNPGWRMTKPINMSSPWRVWQVNQWLKRRRVASHLCEATDEAAECPSGLVLFERLPVGDLCERARAEILDLFEAEKKSPSKLHTATGTSKVSSGMGLFYDDDTPAFVHDATGWLVQRRYFAFVSFIAVYLKAVVSALGGNASDMLRCKMNVVRYFANDGMDAHVDGILNTEKQFGPVATIGMDAGKKCLDLFPTLVPGCEPVRISSMPYQITVMQGAARMDYAHSVPYGQPSERLTLIFFLPCLD